MSPPQYLLDCVGCGQQLAPHAGDWQSTPWLCGPLGCNRGFWTAELTPAARKAWQPHSRDHGHSPEGQAIRDAMHAERDEARLRGTSAREDQLGLLSAAELAFVAKLILAPDFAAKVAAALKARG